MSVNHPKSGDYNLMELSVKGCSAASKKELAKKRNGLQKYYTFNTTKMKKSSR